jgi:hypothetical protein
MYLQRGYQDIYTIRARQDMHNSTLAITIVTTTSSPCATRMYCIHQLLSVFRNRDTLQSRLNFWYCSLKACHFRWSNLAYKSVFKGRPALVTPLATKSPFSSRNRCSSGVHRVQGAGKIMQRYKVTRVMGSAYAARYGGIPLRVYNSAI